MATQPYPNYKYFAPDVLLSVTIALADKFNNLKIRRYGDDLITVVKEIDVGLNTMLPTKMHLERIEDYTSEGGESRFYQTEPFMNLNLTSISRDNTRSYSSNSERLLSETPYKEGFVGDVLSNMQPTPYNFGWTLTIRTNAYEDSSQILEQILPFFNDDAYLRVKELPFLNIERQLKVTLDSVSPDVSSSLGEDEMRSVNWTIDFTLQAWMYRPIRDVGLIEKIEVLMQDTEENTLADFTIHGSRLSDYVLGDYGDTVPSDALDLIVYKEGDVLKIKYKQPLDPIPSDAVNIEVREDKQVVTWKVYN
jgi:hypothetical protein